MRHLKYKSQANTPVMNKIPHIQDVALTPHKTFRHKQNLGGKKHSDEKHNCISLGVISRAQKTRNRSQQDQSHIIEGETTPPSCPPPGRWSRSPPLTAPKRIKWCWEMCWFMASSRAASGGRNMSSSLS